MNFLERGTPRWFTIAPHRPFLADLAGGLLAALGTEGLAEAVVLLPTRRSARALGEALLAAAGGRALLMPQIRALGDLDEDEAPFEPGDIAAALAPPIGPWRRRFELAGLVADLGPLIGRTLGAARALELAEALGALLDACQIEEIVDPDIVGAMADAELAQHWEISAAFLAAALDAWPKRLADLGVMDAWQRRVAVLRLLGRRWAETPPAQVIVAAGSTGTTPAAADLMIAIGQAPRGAVVLPGLDVALETRAWSEVDDQHPQGALKRLVERAGLGRETVDAWLASPDASPKALRRGAVIGEALKPAEATDDWLREIDRMGGGPIGEGLAGLSVIAARDEEEEARIVALLMREALETPGRTCSLVSPDAALARRVTALMARWRVSVDASAGQPLALSPTAVLASLAARWAADPLDPATMLAILKHPMTRLGLGEHQLAWRRASLERTALRGPRARSWEELTARLEPPSAEAENAPSPQRLAALAEASDLLARFAAAMGPARSPFANGAARVGEAAAGLTRALEALAAGGNGALWAGQAGERTAALIAALIGESEPLPQASPLGFAELLDSLIAAEAVPSGAPAHPRLKILGVLEARLIGADVVILASLEEGRWPRAAAVDPFLSRPMRRSLGLPAPERRIGLAAHDFAQAAAAPEVVMIHAERRGGAPAVQSRWLWRLETLARGAGLKIAAQPDVVAWARALDAPIAKPPAHLATAARPKPTPPVAVRPRRISVTGVELWLRDAYAIYARDILKLRPLERPDETVGPRERGSAVHAAFEAFGRRQAFAGDAAAADAAAFETLLREALLEAGMPAVNMPWELARAARLAPFVVQFEADRGPADALLVEQRGEITFATYRGPFTLSAKADRIEVRGHSADILDFKTGAPPSAKQVKAAIAPQLTLTAAILAAGGFTKLGPRQVGELAYVRVSGGRKPLEVKPSFAAPEVAMMADDALARLKRLVAAFEKETTPYTSWRAPQFMARWGGDYDHLARVWEWSVVGEDEDA